MSPTAYPPITVEAAELACIRGGRSVFSGVSFRLSSGELLQVVGPNGAGKSSLLRVLAGLLQPSGGSLRFLPPGEEPIIHYVGHLDALKAAVTLRESLRFWGSVYRQRGSVPVDADFDEAASLVGLRHALDLPVAVFSAGQRRRAALARLCLSPRAIWLLDEPTASLDEEGETILGALIAEHRAAGGLVVAATHQPLLAPAAQTLRLGPSA
jgi:heme exporter protein A